VSTSGEYHYQCPLRSVPLTRGLAFAVRSCSASSSTHIRLYYSPYPLSLFYRYRCRHHDQQVWTSRPLVLDRNLCLPYLSSRKHLPCSSPLSVYSVLRWLPENRLDLWIDLAKKRGGRGPVGGSMYSTWAAIITSSGQLDQTDKIMNRTTPIPYPNNG